jgi:hypothetical protein
VDGEWEEQKEEEDPHGEPPIRVAARVNSLLLTWKSAQVV